MGKEREVTDLRTAAKQALEALTAHADLHGTMYLKMDAITALRAALAEPVEEPVAYIHRQGNHWEVSELHLPDDEKARGWTEEPLYTTPPQRKPLTDETLWEMWVESPSDVLRFARAIEQAHGIGE